MPIYDYHCGRCRTVTEVIHGIHVAGPRFCPACGAEGTMTKGFTTPAVHFKGSGWAKKDRSATASPGRSQASKAAAESGAGSSGAGSSGDGGSGDGGTDRSGGEGGSDRSGGAGKGAKGGASGSGRTDGRSGTTPAASGPAEPRESRTAAASTSTDGGS